MNEWWSSLQPRERLFVGGLGIFLIVFLFYMLLLEPLFKGAADFKARAVSAERQLAWMQASVPNLPSGREMRQAVNTGRSLNVIVDQTRGRYSLAATNTQRVGDDELRVRLEDARFDSIVQWLGDLRRQHGVTIATASVTQTDVRGTTNATLTLSRNSQ